MNILVVNWQDIRNPLGGGAEVHFHEIFKRIVRKGYSVTLLCSRFKDAPCDEFIDDVRIVRRGTRNTFNFHVPYWYWKLSRQNRFDVVVDDINKIPFYTPLFVKEPLVGIIHHLFGRSIYRETNFPSALYVNVAENLALRIYRKIRIAVVSPSTQSELIEHGFDKKNLPIVPNCVDHSIYFKRENQEYEYAHIGYLGRIKKYKSIDHLLHAFKIILGEIPNAKLSILGDGDEKEKLQSLADELGISERVEFHGFVNEVEKVELLNRMHVVANPSVKEGWGLTVIETNACGVPVVASDVPGLRDSVIDEKTGLLFEYGNVEQLSQKLLLVIRDSHLRERLAERACEWAKSFDWNVSAEKMLDVLKKVTKGS